MTYRTDRDYGPDYDYDRWGYGRGYYGREGDYDRWTSARSVYGRGYYDYDYDR
jgi:hypothetical protein